jgi:hypothetical protein
MPFHYYVNRRVQRSAAALATLTLATGESSCSLAIRRSALTVHSTLDELLGPRGVSVPVAVVPTKASSSKAAVAEPQSSYGPTLDALLRQADAGDAAEEEVGVTTSSRQGMDAI